MKTLAGRSRVLWIAAAAIAAAVLALGYRSFTRDPLVEAAANIQYRVFEARLTGDFPYRPLPRVTRGAGDESAPERRPAPFVAAAAAAAGLRDTGRAQLMLQEWEHAAKVLDDAVRAETGREHLPAALAESADAELLSDVAAAHHAAARHTDDPRHYLIAAEAAERAWRIAKTPEIAWNRALAIEALHLRAIAGTAWRQYLALDAGSPWAAEVGARMRRLGARTTLQLWREAQPRLRRAVAANDLRTIERVILEFPEHARHECEQKTLAEWANTYRRSPSTAAPALALCRAVGEVLHRNTSESLLYDTVAKIDAADGDRLEAMVESLAAYGVAVETRHNEGNAAACPRWAEAFERLRAAGLPLAHKARMYMTLCDRFGSDARRTGASFDARRYRALEAQTRWVRGLPHIRTGRPQAALEEYEEAHAIFVSLREPDSVASMKSMLAEAHGYLGDRDRSWHLYFAVLEQLAAGGSDQRQMVDTLRLVADMARREGLAATALLFTDQYLLVLGEPAVFDIRFRVLLLRADIHRDLGDEAAARADVRAAEALLPKIPRKDAREEAMLAPEVVRSRLDGITDPAARERILGDAVDFARKRKFKFRLAPLLLEQGREQAHARRYDSAKKTLYEALAQVESERDTVRDEDRRGTFVTARQPVHEALAALLCSGGEYGAAFDVVERGRARSLMDRMSGRGEPLRDLAGVGQIAATLPANTALISFAPVGEALAVWIVSAHGVRFVATKVDGEELQRKVDRFRLAARDGDDPAARRAAAELYDLLIRPWDRHARRFEKLVFIPDDRLGGLPFAALLDRTSGQFLVQRHIVANAPSANVFASSVARDRKGKAATGSALIVAPSTARSSAGGNALLAATRREAADVAKRYEQAEVLTGPLATRAAFLERAARAWVIHFGGHAYAERRGAPRLVLAADTNGESETIRVQDIREMRLDRTRVVVLAACISASDFQSTQGTSSLARAFLAAGVPAVIGTYWDVDDEAAGELSRRLHAHLAAGREPAAALCLAQRQMLAARDADTAAMGSWAAFAVLGGTDK